MSQYESGVDLCHTANLPSVNYIFGHEVQQPEAVLICDQLGGYLPLPTESNKTEVALQAVENPNYGCKQWNKQQWLPVNRDESDGIWKHSTTK